VTDVQLVVPQAPASIAIVGVGAYLWKFRPEIVTIAAPVCGELPEPAEITGLSYVKPANWEALLPERALTVRTGVRLTSPTPGAGAAQLTPVRDVHDVVVHSSVSIIIEGVISADTKFMPRRVTEFPPECAALVGLMAVSAGPS